MLFNPITTNDLMIRSVLKEILMERHLKDKKVKIIEELGLQHGNSRIDIAVINGIMDGYEIKSDQDTLLRLPEQTNSYNKVFDKVTLVVGKSHLHNAIKIIPDWWGVLVAKINSDGQVVFNTIREAEFNVDKNTIAMAQLLWKEEALKILEEAGKATGLYSKTRDTIYKKLTSVLDQKTLGDKVREALFIRTNWRSDALLMSNGD